MPELTKTHEIQVSTSDLKVINLALEFFLTKYPNPHIPATRAQMDYLFKRFSRKLLRADPKLLTEIGRMRARGTDKKPPEYPDSEAVHHKADVTPLP